MLLPIIARGLVENLAWLHMHRKNIYLVFQFESCCVCSAEESLDFGALLSRPNSEILQLRVEDLVKEYFQTAEKVCSLSVCVKDTDKSSVVS